MISRILDKCYRRFIGPWAEAKRFEEFRRSRPDAFFVLNFHQSTPTFDPTRHARGTWTNIDDLRTLASSLNELFAVVSLAEGVERWRARRLRGWTCAITFDDGDPSVAEYVVPLLEQLGLPATFFVNTAYFEDSAQSWISVLARLEHDPSADPSAQEWIRAHGSLAGLKRELRWTHDPSKYNELRSKVLGVGKGLPARPGAAVSSDWIAALDAKQFHVGLHGHEHDRFSMMEPSWQAANIEKNINILKQFPSYQPIFAVPFGRPIDFDRTTVKCAFEFGLEIALADHGINTMEDIFLKRIPFDNCSLERDLPRRVFQQ